MGVIHLFSFIFRSINLRTCQILINPFLWWPIRLTVKPLPKAYKSLLERLCANDGAIFLHSFTRMLRALHCIIIASALHICSTNSRRSILGKFWWNDNEWQNHWQKTYESQKFSEKFSERQNYDSMNQWQSILCHENQFYVNVLQKRLMHVKILIE